MPYAIIMESLPVVFCVLLLLSFLGCSGYKNYFINLYMNHTFPLISIIMFFIKSSVALMLHQCQHFFPVFVMPFKSMICEKIWLYFDLQVSWSEIVGKIHKRCFRLVNKCLLNNSILLSCYKYNTIIKQRSMHKVSI